MKLPLNVLSLLVVVISFGNEVFSQTDSIIENQGYITEIEGRTLQQAANTADNGGFFDTFLVGPRINYTQGKYGFLGASASFAWHQIGYVFESHIGVSAGMDLRLTKSMVYAPKFTVEYRYVIGIARVGYQYFTDFKSGFEHRISAEIGISLLSFLDITYLHSFGSARIPFQLGSNYLNLTATIPLNL